MVLTQRYLGHAEWFILVMFPYHYGSYATFQDAVASERLPQVSIPLWFLRNM